MSSKSAIETFIFFDLETTNLIRNNVVPEILELSLVAISGKSFLNLDGRSEIPRIVDKLSIALRPRQNIHPQAAKISQLNASLLEKHPYFNEDTCELIALFLKQLPGKKVLISHNGLKFDFPIILEHFRRFKKRFDDTILCVDSLVAFRQFSCDNVTLNSVRADAKRVPEIDYSNFDKLWDLALLECLGEPEVLEKEERDNNFSIRNTSFALENIYKKIFKSAPEKIHNSEFDCLILLRCCLHYGKHFLEWTERNAIAINECKVNFKR